MLEKINYLKIISELEKNRLVFETMLKGLKKEEYLWKPVREKWCLLEIVCHLNDEELEDFRARTRHALETPADPLIAIDPQGWVEARKYNEQIYEETLNKFLNYRLDSVQWLQTLSNANWDNAYVHPKFGRMSAEMFLSNWLAHDYLHIRQIIKLKFDYLKTMTSEDLGYAGNW